MRKVLFKKWIPIITEIIEGIFGKESARVKGTGCWEDDFTQEGIFHQWAASYEEFETGPGNYTVALVELPDGTISEVLPSNLKFVEPIYTDKEEKR